jgi:membrane protein implicated in regulation of membrane protease activity
MDLKWFHLVFITLSIILSVAVAAWAFGASQWALAIVAIGVGIALVVYERYFVRKTRRID